MKARILEILSRAEESDSRLIETIRAAGGSAIAPAENNQPDAKLQIASVHFGGIVGLGPGLLGAAKDWRRQARGRVKA